MNTSITVSEKPPDTEAEAKSGRSPRDTSTSMEKKTISSPAAIGKNEAAALLAQIAQPQVINPALQNNVQKIPQNSKIMVGVRPELKKALELMRNLKFHEAILSLRSYIIPLCGDENGDLKSTSKGNEAERAAQALESLSKIPSNLASEKHLLLAICYLMVNSFVSKLEIGKLLRQQSDTIYLKILDELLFLVAGPTPKCVHLF
mmetsp:Transcript_25877/g.36155  ORF Transcript_25877/g.36155 Transcript_25877/m.36155 type:complete len:204 (-) Transcript_25877:1568-2179(-)